MTGFREVKKRRRKDRIYDAALALLDEKGFAATHMRDISERAELAVGTLYNYYSSKYDLYMEIMEEKWAEINRYHQKRVVEAVQRGTDLLAVLKEIFFPALRDMFSLGIGEWTEIFMMAFSSKSYVERGARMDEEAVAMVETFMVKLQKRGLLRPEISPRLTAFSLYSIIVFNVMALLFTEVMDEDEFFDTVEEQFRLVIEGVGCSAPKEERYENG
jgi:AcrR family transcriptional regulator